MVDKRIDNLINPKQPYFVMATSHYYKVIVMNYGISHFYCFCSDEKNLDSIIGLPDGCIDILFCCDEDIPWAEIYGTGLYARPMVIEGSKYYFGVRFLPGQCLILNKISFKELIGIEVPFIDIINEEIFTKIVNNRNFYEQIHIFMDFYLKNREKVNIISSNDKLSVYLLDEILKSKGNVHIEDLSKKSEYSIRYINKIFKDNYGISPKLFSKVIRFQSLLGTINKSELTEIDFAGVAAELDYYDESHMIKDFRQFANTTPKRYVEFMQKKKFDKRLIVYK